jgi:hypothetical protein
MKFSSTNLTNMPMAVQALWQNATQLCVICVIFVLCLIVVPLPPGINPFAVKISNRVKSKVKLSP